jgi:HD-GYP domain-containing protein (c-di-GMP phosphodiesterase class II)
MTHAGRGDPPDTEIRRRGRAFLISFSTALRSLKLYPLENEQPQKALSDLVTAGAALHELDPVLEVRVAGDIIFLNGTRLRIDLDNYASFNHVLKLLGELGVGRLQVDEGMDRQEWATFVALLIEVAAHHPDPNEIFDLRDRLGNRGVTHVSLDPPTDEERDLSDAGGDVAVAKRTYERTVAVTREAVESIRMGRGAGLKKLKRAVQGVVDQVLNNEVSLVGLTTLRDYDEYTFTHSVNVCIFAVALGRRLELSKRQLYDLGMAALLHDIGKSRVPVEVLKRGGLSEAEWGSLRAHPWQGVLALFAMRGQGDLPYRSMIAAYEHHMKVDMSGYPRPTRPRTPSLFSKIVAVTDGYDAATSRRSYQTTPVLPDQVLREMWDNPNRGYDRVLVKELINLVGIYPVGTGVILNTREVAVVHAGGRDPKHLNRPVVRIVVDAEGTALSPGEIVDLTDVDEYGEYPRSITRVADLMKLGLNPVEYFT